MPKNPSYSTTKFLIFCLKLFGLAPFNLVLPPPIHSSETYPTFTYSLYGSIYCTFLLTVVFFFHSWYLISFYVEEFYTSTIYRKLEVAAFYLSSSLAYVSILSSHIRQQKVVVQIGNDLISVDKHLSNFYYHYNPRKHDKKVIFSILLCTLVLGYFYFIEIRAYQKGAWYFGVWVHYTIVLSTIEYLVVMKTISYRFEAIQNCLRGMEVQEVDDNSWKIKLLRQCHHILCRNFYAVSKFFGIPLLFTVTHSLEMSTISFYLITVAIIQGSLHNLEEIVVAENTWISILLVPLVLMTLVVYDCKQVGKTRISEAVHDLELRTRRKENLELLKEFSLYLQHIDLSATAQGLFPLDGRVIHSMASAMAMYFIVLVQFHQTTEGDL